MPTSPALNDLKYAWYGGTPDINSAEYQALLAAYNDGVNAFTLILSFAGLPDADDGDVLTADGLGFATWQPGGGGGGGTIAILVNGVVEAAAATSLDLTGGVTGSAVGNAVTADVLGAQKGLLASRPAAAAAPRMAYYATDTSAVYISDGATWTTAVMGVVAGGTGATDAPTARANLNVPILASAKAVSTSNVASLSGTTTIDGFALIAGDIVLLTAQSAGAENGPWTIAAGAWTRPSDYANGSTVRGRVIEVNGGAVYGGTLWCLTTTAVVTVGTTATTWAIVGVTAGVGIDKTGNVVSQSMFMYQYARLTYN